MADKVKRPRGLAKAESLRVMELLQKNGTVSLEEFGKHVRGRYIFKNIFFLRSMGAIIKANREKRKVVSYTLIDDRAYSPGSSTIEEAQAAIAA